ncbi:hypothetical protein GOP47_0022298 [Adiantum capillus-veneris]|uniref:Uncharacterized protein n=1 Tax=Adiantum capillus-veneris TaxID=13818 RepID=A0A9D4UB21_ADICA|nr:hypothetical protein GOP47_0022298 [Adiantum capillus-veneris]
MPLTSEWVMLKTLNNGERDSHQGLHARGNGEGPSWRIGSESITNTQVKIGGTRSSKDECGGVVNASCPHGYKQRCSHCCRSAEVNICLLKELQVTIALRGKQEEPKECSEIINGNYQVEAANLLNSSLLVGM